MSDFQPCPYCAEPCTADWVDVGVGFVQCGPYHCEACGASEIGPYDNARELSDQERRTGWYGPYSEPGSSANAIGGKIVSANEAKAAYAAEFTGNPAYEEPGVVEAWWAKQRSPG